MQLLLLYWSIMIAMYIIAAKLVNKDRDYSFLDRGLNIVIYILVLLMGMRMGANEEVTSNLKTIGISSLAITAMTVLGSMAFVFIARKLMGLNRYGVKLTVAEDVSKGQDDVDTENSSGAKTTVLIMLCVALGMILGYFIVPRLFSDLEVFQNGSENLLVVGICILLGMVGFSLGLSGNFLGEVKNMGIGVIIIPIAAVLGSLLAGVAFGLVSSFSIREAVAISAGFGWYTLAPTMISEAGYQVAGAVSFLHNVIRETLGIIIIPLAATKIGYLESVSIPGVAAMDVCMPIVERSCRKETVVYSFCTGVVMCIAVPVVVPLVI